MQKNKITTLGYFLKRIRDNKFAAIKIWSKYDTIDPRKWTVLVDPSKANIFITCYENKDFHGEKMFEFNDGGRLFPKNYSLKTSSMEVIVLTLLERGVEQITNSDEFYKDPK